jgi:hypothetical protein
MSEPAIALAARINAAINNLVDAELEARAVNEHVSSLRDQIARLLDEVHALSRLAAPATKPEGE